MSDFNALWQGRVGWRSGVIAPSQASTLWTSVYAIYNADTVGSSSLKTSLYAAYNGESNANDSFGSNNGTAQGGLTYTAGKIGNAFQFNGTNSYISLPDNSLNFTGDFSVSAWINVGNVSGEKFLISNVNGNGTNLNFGWVFGLLNNQLSFGSYGNTVFSSWNTSSTLLANTWYHVLVTKKPSETPKLYINGVLSTSTLHPNSSGTNSTNPVYSSATYPNIKSAIGTYIYNNGTSLYGYWNGKIDALNVYQKELTQSEITELYNSGNGAQYITDSFYKPTSNDALNTNNGTAQGGLTYVPGKVGTAFQFNGTNSYIQLPQYSMRFTNSFSISCWTYTTANQTGYKALIGDYYYSGGDYGYTISISSANKVSVFVVGAGGTPYGFNSNITLSNNQWNNIAVVWDKANTNLKLYVNGTLDTSLTTALASTITYAAGSNRTNIGTSNSSPTSGIGSGVFNGLIDAINVWNKVLTVSEITELYNSANGKQYPN